MRYAVYNGRLLVNFDYVGLINVHLNQSTRVFFLAFHPHRNAVVGYRTRVPELNSARAYLPRDRSGTAMH